MCKKNFDGVGWESVNKTGSLSCQEGIPIINCEYALKIDSINNQCYSCKKNYAVSSSKFSCVSFTTDVNCRQLNLGEEHCHYCWHGYYWDKY